MFPRLSSSGTVRDHEGKRGDGLTLLGSETCQLSGKSALLLVLLVFASPVHNGREKYAPSTDLVKVLQQVDYPALNLVLGKTSGSRVESNSLGGEAGRELRRADSWRAAEPEASRRGPGCTGNGGSQGADNSGTEHVGGCGGKALEQTPARRRKRYIELNREDWGRERERERGELKREDCQEDVITKMLLKQSKILPSSQSARG